MKIRNRFVMFILIYIFDIIYLFYWLCSVQSGIDNDKDYKNSINVWVTVLLIIGTLGLYILVWQWLTCNYLKQKGGSDVRLITLILSLLIIGLIINPLIIQGQINKVLKKQYPVLKHVT